MPERQLKRALSAFDLTCIGIGAIIGTGIFALAGTAAAGEQAHAVESIWKTPVLNFVQSWTTHAALVFGRPGARPAVMLSLGNVQFEQGLFGLSLGSDDFCARSERWHVRPLRRELSGRVQSGASGQCSTAVLDLRKSFVWSISRVGRNAISGFVALHLDAGRYRRTHN
jgi:hypothetical protein